jgi:hypothetical protein
VILLVIGALPIFLYYQSKKGWQGFAKDFRAALWLIIYLPTMALLSYLGSDDFGGIGVLSGGWDMLVVALSATAFYYWGVSSGYRTQYLEESVALRGTTETETKKRADTRLQKPGGITPQPR